MTEYTAQIAVIKDDLEKVVEKAVIRLGLNVTANLIKTTPVDTGWAQANWVPAIGVTPLGSSSIDATPEMVASQAARQARSQASILGYRLGAGNVFIANNVPYITDLNAGSSRQAPAGFVQQAIQLAVAQAERKA